MTIYEYVGRVVAVIGIMGMLCVLAYLVVQIAVSVKRKALEFRTLSRLVRFWNARHGGPPDRCGVNTGGVEADGDWLCDGCNRWFSDAMPRVGTECELCPACAKALEAEAKDNP